MPPPARVTCVYCASLRLQSGDFIMTEQKQGPQSRDWRPIWNFDDPAASEQRFVGELARLNSPHERAELLTQIARARGLQRRFDEANEVLDAVEAMGDLPAFVRVRLLLERGRVLNSSGQRDGARPLFEQACELAAHHDEDDLAVDAAHMVAFTCDGDEAMEWNLKALAMAEASTCARARRWAGSLHNNLGWTLHPMGRHDEALAHFEAALAARIEQGDEQQIGIARWCIARCLRSLRRLDEALNIQRELLREHEQRGTTSGYVFEELGECLLELGRAEEARPWFVRAHAELSQDPWLAEREPDRIKRLADLGGAG